MKHNAEKWYKKMILERINDESKVDEYYEFCLNHLKENIFDIYSSKGTANNVIAFWFKKGMAKKHMMGLSNWDLKKYEEREKHEVV